VVVFPILILVVFYLLVTRHHWKLYSPRDFRKDSSFQKQLTPAEVDKKIEKKIEESVIETKAFEDKTSASLLKDDKNKSANNLGLQIAEYREIERVAIIKLADELDITVNRDVRFMPFDITFDAVSFYGNKLIAIEVKMLKTPFISPSDIHSILYKALLISEKESRDFQFIIAIVYSFEEGLLKPIKEQFNRVKNDYPFTITIKYISIDQIFKPSPSL
jgi:hypothetical protein